jgi:hypothetical protein
MMFVRWPAVAVGGGDNTSDKRKDGVWRGVWDVMWGLVGLGSLLVLINKF